MKCYCTAGRGTEVFLEREISRRWADNVIKIEVEDGKVFFELGGSVKPTELLTLKSAERIFLQIFHEKATKIACKELFNLPENPQTFVDNLIARGLSDRQAWHDCMSLWRSVNERGHSTDDDDGQCTEPEPKRQRLSKDLHPVRFAVAMKCTGSVRYRLHPQRTPRQLAMGICRHTGWKTDVRRPQIEVSVHLSEAFVTVGIPLVNKPLSKRSFIKHYGLRTTVAWIMVDLLDIQCGDTVLDPMCGKATILLEAAHSNKEGVYIGVDRDVKQLALARDNTAFAEHLNNTPVELVLGDVTGLPIHSGSVNKIVTDAPFGHKHTTEGDIHTFYLRTMAEMSRVMAPGGRLVLLTSPDLRHYIYRLLGVELGDTKNNITNNPHPHSNQNTDQDQTSNRKDTGNNIDNITDSECIKDDTCSKCNLNYKCKRPVTHTDINSDSTRCSCNNTHSSSKFKDKITGYHDDVSTGRGDADESTNNKMCNAVSKAKEVNKNDGNKVNEPKAGSGDDVVAEDNIGKSNRGGNTSGNTENNLPNDTSDTGEIKHGDINAVEQEECIDTAISVANDHCTHVSKPSGNDEHCLINKDARSSATDISGTNRNNMTHTSRAEVQNCELKSNATDISVSAKHKLESQNVFDLDISSINSKGMLKHFQLCDSHYMKLGDTDSYIVVMQKIANKDSY